MSEIIRNSYLKELCTWKDQKRIKVITGVRRCGKSTVLNQYINILKTIYKIRENQIQVFDFNNPKLLKFSYMELYDNILKNSIKGKKNYIFLDEIQEIKDFEKCVIGLYENKDIDFDIYITGSNSRMFSQELATLFTGRETEIHIFPLSFKEIYDFSIQKTNVIDKYTIFNQYKMFGGLPILLEHYENVEMNKKDLAMVVDGCIQKDIRNRNKIRNFVNFRKVTKYVFLQIGQMLSVLNLASYIESNNKETLSHHTITRYLLWLCEALLVYKCENYDLNGKKVLLTTSKYYAVDTGIRNCESDFSNVNNGSQLENIVYIELLRRGYKVYVGKLKNGEIDFVAKKFEDTIFIQVTEKIDWDIESKNYKREIGNLEAIKIHEPKMILSLYDSSQKTPSGIKIFNLIDWLLAN